MEIKFFPYFHGNFRVNFIYGIGLFLSKFFCINVRPIYALAATY